jgi:hypothetical protein
MKTFKEMFPNLSEEYFDEHQEIMITINCLDRDRVVKVAIDTLPSEYLKLFLSKLNQNI